MKARIGHHEIEEVCIRTKPDVGCERLGNELSCITLHCRLLIVRLRSSCLDSVPKLPSFCLPSSYPSTFVYPSRPQFVGQLPLSNQSSQAQIQIWRRPCLSCRSLFGWKHKDILPFGSSNLDHILISNLHIPRLSNSLPIQFGPIGTLQVHQIWSHNIHLLRPFPKLSLHLLFLLLVTKLDHGMLTTGTRMLNQDIGDSSLAANQPARAGIQQHRLHDILTLEDVQTPLL